VLGTPDPAAQLIQIGQAEAIGAINDNGVAFGMSKPFRYGSAHQHIDFSHDKAMHYRFQFVGIHLAVTNSTRAFGQSSATRSRTFRSIARGYAEKKLALPLQFPIDASRIILSS